MVTHGFTRTNIIIGCPGYEDKSQECDLWTHHFHHFLEFSHNEKTYFFTKGLKILKTKYALDLRAMCRAKLT